MIKGDLLNIPNNLLAKFQANEIDEIMITGMGTCHSAAVAIAANMRRHLILKQSIRITTHLASELSAFHLRENMGNTLVIAIAQSGTTIDTNVAVKLVKARGAFTLAILNKRQGDISYLVDTTIYLGNGRDIEIAVPSTKTYICHIVLAYILTFFLDHEINKRGNDNYQFLTKITDLPQKILNTIENYNSTNLTSCLNKFLKIPNWYVVYDSPYGFTAGTEARIKLSECCYQSVPLLSVEEFLNAGVNSSLVILLAGSTKKRIQNFLDKARICKNYILLLGDNQLIGKIQFTKGSGTKLQYHKILGDLSIIPMIINCQLLAYNIALKLDRRQHYFLRIIDEIESQKDCKIRLQEMLSMGKDDPHNVGYQEDKLTSLRKNTKKYLMSSKKEDLDLVKKDLWYFVRHSMRPIDAIKHQAKTITVGTQRQERITENKSSTIISNFQKKLPFSSSSLNEKRSNKLDKAQIPTAFLIGEKVDYKLLKFMVNFLNNSSLNFDELPKFNYEIKNEVVGTPNEKIFQISLHRKGKRYLSKIDRKNEIFLEDNAETKQLLKQIQKHPGTTQNEVFHTLLNGMGACICILRFLLKSSDEDLLNFYIGMLVEQIAYVIEYSETKEHKVHVVEISHMIRSAKNIKFLGSGENYDAANYLSILSIKKFGKPCTSDVLENHKHIDMSAEPIIINLISNILDDSYQNDAYSEIEKAHSHNNTPIIITNSFDYRFDKTDMDVIKIPCVAREISLLTYIILFKKLLF